MNSERFLIVFAVKSARPVWAVHDAAAPSDIEVIIRNVSVISNHNGLKKYIAEVTVVNVIRDSMTAALRYVLGNRFSSRISN